MDSDAQVRQVGDSDFRIGPGGWVRGRLTTDGKPTVTLYIRLAVASHGDLEVVQAVIDSPTEALTPSRLRELAPLLRKTETAARHPARRNQLLGRLDHDTPNVGQLADCFPDDTADDQPDGDYRVSYMKVDVPRTKPYPDEFYRSFATAYGIAVMLASEDGSGPAKLVAEANGVDVRRVHRWTAKARELGYLPPARTGRKAL